MPESEISLTHIKHESLSPKRSCIIPSFPSGDPALSALCRIQVVVLDQNDEAPQFDRALYSKAVSEDAPGGTRVIQVSLFFF